MRRQIARMNGNAAYRLEPFATQEPGAGAEQGRADDRAHVIRAAFAAMRGDAMSGTIDLNCSDAGIRTDRDADESNGGSSSGSVRRVGRRCEQWRRRRNALMYDANSCKALRHQRTWD